MPRKSSVKPDIGTKHTGNRSQTVRDSNNVIQAEISGSENIVNIYPQSKSGNVSKIQVNEFSNILTILGRWLLKHLGINKFYCTIVISLISSGYFSIDMFTVKLLPKNAYITALGIIWFVLAFYIFVLYFERTCKECGRRFAYKEISATHLGRVKYKGKIHHNIDSLYKCDFCGHEFVKKSVEVEEVDRR
jgi:DNA-directed RNA polymerase subunit RPC12/RpoP